MCVNRTNCSGPMLVRVVWKNNIYTGLSETSKEWVCLKWTYWNWPLGGVYSTDHSLSRWVWCHLFFLFVQHLSIHLSLFPFGVFVFTRELSVAIQSDQFHSGKTVLSLVRNDSKTIFPRRSGLTCFTPHPSVIVWFTYAQMNHFLRWKHCLFRNKGPKRVRSESTLILWEQYDVSWPEDQNWHRSHTQASHIIRYFFFYRALFLHRCVWPDLGMCEEGSQFRESGKQNLGMTFSWSSASLERREDFSNCNTRTPVNSGSPVSWLSGTQQKVNHNFIT